MSQIYVRRTTAALLGVIVLLSLVSVALLVLALSPGWRSTCETTVFKSTARPEKISKPGDLEGQSARVEPGVVTTAASTPATPSLHQPEQPWEKNYRIPDTTIPHHYDLYLHPDLTTGWFTGRVTILVGVTAPMTFLVTHVKAMNVTSTKLMEQDTSREIAIKKAFEHEPNEFWVVLPQQQLKPGNYSLQLTFNGSLDGHIVGFYRSVYITRSGEKRSIATSKFQPTDARRTFPCFDEPSFKSTFSTTLVRPTHGYVALSNMPQEEEIPDSPAKGVTEVKFQKSVPMVTYLACFIVCDFQYLEKTTQEGKPFRVYATPDQVERANYSTEIGVHILDFFEKYFEVEYPLPKQDMIAIPDFVSGAMEHWGLITFREANLLYDSFGSSSYNKQRVATVVSHELAHMWFGNLVTLKWWNDLWLNEGFASYIEYKGVQAYEQDWQMSHQFVVEDLQYVMKLDQALSSHPIVQPVSHPDEITEIFDAISYSKGASVLRMLEDFMGAETFRLGVRNFLRKHRYANAVTQDLWDELQKVDTSGVNVTDVMDTWTGQMGFPVLSVKTDTAHPAKLHVTQARFLLDSGAAGKASDDSPFGYKWEVPVTFRTSGQNRTLVWLNRTAPEIIVSKAHEDTWVKFNVEQFGFYRVNYDDSLWVSLIRLLRSDHTVLSQSDRAGLIDDAFSLASAEQLPYDTAFSISAYLSQESDYVPWVAASDHLTSIGYKLRTTKAYPLYRKYILSLVGEAAKRIGWEDTGSHLDRRLRIILLSLACNYGDGHCLSEAKVRFLKWIKDEHHFIPANLRTLVYSFGVQGSGEDEWNVLLKRMIKETNSQEVLKMLDGLASTKEDWIIYRALDLAKNASTIRTQDYLTFVRRLGQNTVGHNPVWDFVRDEWKFLVDRFTLNNRYLGVTVKSVISPFSTERDLREVNDFFALYPDAGSGQRARLQGIEEIEKNIRWLKAHSDNLYKWLQRNVKEADSHPA